MKTCQRCKGDRLIEVDLKNLGTLEWVRHIIACPMCDGKGIITQEMIEAQYRGCSCKTS